MSNYKACPTCGEYGFINDDRPFLAHRCKPAWECRLEANADDADGWYTVHATDAEQAAERYAEQYDCDGGEYAIVSGNFRDECIIQVRKHMGFEDDEPPFERFSVEGETVPQYRATKAD